jgi:hypothetical protein
MDFLRKLFGAKQPTASPSRNETPKSFTELLNTHIERLRDAFPQFKSFLDTHFIPDRVAFLAKTGQEQMLLTLSDGQVHTDTFSHPPTAYIVTAIPVDLEHISIWFVENFGGYTQFLERVRNAPMLFINCSVLCHVIYGQTKSGAWVHMSIVPMAKSATTDFTIVPIVPVEFLTESEKHQLFG